MLFKKCIDNRIETLSLYDTIDQHNIINSTQSQTQTNVLCNVDGYSRARFYISSYLSYCE